jgi:carbon storage regulator
MLVLSRKIDEEIIIGDGISIMVVDIRGDKVRLGINAPRDVTVHRKEVYEAIQREGTNVEATSTAGGGTRIEFDVPRHTSSSEDEAAGAANSLESQIRNEGT